MFVDEGDGADAMDDVLIFLVLWDVFRAERGGTTGCGGGE
jgi:hypothetical protein